MVIGQTPARAWQNLSITHFVGHLMETCIFLDSGGASHVTLTADFLPSCDLLASQVLLEDLGDIRASL